MMSVIVLATGENTAPADARELAVRSLVWLVSAVVAGTVRDVVIACPPSWPVSDAMEQAGCELVVAAQEAARVAAAAAAVKCARVLLLRVGFQAEGPLAAEVDALLGRTSPADTLTILAAPSRWHERLFPRFAPVCGLLLPRQRLLASPASFATLTRTTPGPIARARMVPVL